ncbi:MULTISPECIES: IS66 family insertion sequence element accessory protein TnpB [Mesorhizobium]|uniref:Transposase n=1 Tax=Mesorhizobium huakuii TaxID=28104 RepID=A0A7G6T6I7_9HYPH|nr:transposase [Mesorhizobium huakuii]QND69546.1 transposase [Mesorhizobium loti]
MIASGVVVYVSCQPVDFRKGAASLMALVRDGGLDPFSGALHVFRSKRADRVKTHRPPRREPVGDRLRGRR